MDDVYQTINDNISGVAIKLEGASADRAQWNASDVNFIKDERQLTDLESVRSNAGLKLHVSIDNSGVPTMNDTFDLGLREYYQVPSVIDDLFAEFSQIYC